MKKLSAIILVLSMLMAVSLTGCGDKEKTQTNSQSLASQKSESLDNAKPGEVQPEVEEPTEEEEVSKEVEPSKDSSKGTKGKSKSQLTEKSTAPKTNATKAPSSTKPTSTKAPSSTTTTKKPAVTNGLMSTFSATDIYGTSYNQNMLKGKKLTVVNLWATWCGPCRNEMPDLGTLSTEYASKGVQFIGILHLSNGSTAAGAKPIVEESGALYPHLLCQGDLVSIINKANGYSDTLYLPMTFCVDEDGVKVGDTITGSMNIDQWRSYINNCLAAVS